MDANTIRLMCAEAAGWSCAYRHGEMWSVQRNGVELESSHEPASLLDALFVHCPDYPNDLNACAELRKLLTEEERVKYMQALDDATYKPGEAWSNIIDATALDHATAFLRAKGLLPEKGAGE